MMNTSPATTLNWPAQGETNVTAALEMVSPSTVTQAIRPQAIKSAPLRPALQPFIRAEWADLEYRQAYLEASIEQGLAWQIRANRKQRGWSQEDLANKIGTGQSAVSRLEDPAYGGHSMATLVSIAHAFDCALIVKFAPYSELGRLSEDLSPKALYAPSFTEEAKEIAT